MEQAITTWRAAPFLRGMRAIVTAGAGGIGRRIADLLIEQGCAVAVCDISDEALEDFRATHGQSGARAIPADVSSERDVERLFAEAIGALGGLDILVNNAGIAGQTGRVEEQAPDEWRRCLDVTLTGSYLCARKAVPSIREAGGGSIVNISSVAGRFGYAYRTPYSSAKYGIIGLTESLAKELGPASIRVNAVLPGIVEGPRIQRVIAARAEQTGVSIEEMTREYLSKVSMRRMVTQDDVANMVAFLVSPMAAMVSGQSIAVCGNVETL